MFLVVVVLSAVVKVYVGDLSLDIFNLARWQGIGIVVCLFLLVSFLLDLFASFAELKNFKDHESGKINIVGLWKKVYTNPLSGIILITVMTFGITSAQSLSDYYRDNVITWYDADLWALEASFFYSLKGSLIDFPVFWDKVYFAFWNYLIFVYCVLYRLRRLYNIATISIATIFCFFLTRWIALQYPTAGPVFFKPDLFHLSGTAIGTTQKFLALYMRGACLKTDLFQALWVCPVFISALLSWQLLVPLQKRQMDHMVKWAVGLPCLVVNDHVRMALCPGWSKWDCSCSGFCSGNSWNVVIDKFLLRE